MIKFLYSTDWHAKGKSPSTRTDDFPTTIELKIKHFFQVGHEMEVDFFVVGGDFVDTAYLSPRYTQRIGKVIKEAAQGKKIFFVWGNHDIVAWNPTTSADTAFGLFQAFYDDMILLDEPKVYDFHGEKIILSGVSSYANLDRDILDEEGNILAHRVRDYVFSEVRPHPHVHVVHGYLSPKAILDDIPHTVISDMKHTTADVTLTGHEHTGFSVTKLDTGYAYNPGALGRVFASHTEMNRMPQYAYVELDQDKTVRIRPIPCTIAQAGELVFDRSFLDEKRAKEELLLQTKGNLQELLNTINIENIDLRAIMYRFKEKIEPQVYEEVKRRLNI